MRKAARIITYLFHPLLMPTLGLLIILNSGTYLSLLDPAAKRAILFVMALGTLIFPLIMIPVLYYRNLIPDLQNPTREERLAPQLIVLILYVITFIYFVRLPLSRVIHAYVLSVPVSMLILMAVGIRFSLSSHMTGLGGITGLIIAILVIYQTPLVAPLLLVILVAGTTATALLVLDRHHPAEVYAGYFLGLGAVLVTILVY